MSENIAQILEEKENEILSQSEQIKDDTSEETKTINKCIRNEIKRIISIINFNTWFTKYFMNDREALIRDYLKLAQLELKGLDKNKNILVTYPNSKNKLNSDGDIERNIYVFEGCDTLPALDLKPNKFSILKDGFMIEYDLSDVLVRSYTKKQKMFVTFSKKINDIILTYATYKIRRKNYTVIEIPNLNISNEDINKILNNLNSDILSIINGKFTEVKTGEGEQFIKSLNEKFYKCNTINNLMQIDFVLTSILGQKTDIQNT